MKIISVVLVFCLGGWSSASPDGSHPRNKYATLLTESKTASDVSGVLIVGGKPADRNEFPWLVHLQIDGNMCGGSLIDMDLVLTAAHCVVKNSGNLVSPSKITVIAGLHIRNSLAGTEQARASAVKIHEKYNMINFKNDIALIRVSKKFTPTLSVKPIAYHNSSTNQATKGTVAGWGTTSFEGLTSNHLLKVEVPIVTGPTCANQTSYPKGQFCAGAFRKDSCQGDSGGPFICNNRPNVICGIVSYGEGCGELYKPGVYTKVSAYIDWIDRNRYDFSSSTVITPVKHTLLVTLALTFFVFLVT